MRALILTTGLLLAGLSAGCVNTDTAVFVDPTPSNPAATVTGGALGVSLKGSFDLKLHLGARASGPSKVTLGAFAIADATAQMNAIVASLPVATTTTFPVTVDLDSDVDVAFTFDTGTKPLSADLQPKLCDPAGVVLSGTIQDSLQDRATPFHSAVFHPAGCM